MLLENDYQDERMQQMLVLMLANNNKTHQSMYTKSYQ